MVQEEFGWVRWKSTHSMEYKSLLSVHQCCQLICSNVLSVPGCWVTATHSGVSLQRRAPSSGEVARETLAKEEYYCLAREE